MNKIPFEIPTTAQSRYREIPFSLSSEPGKREQPSVNAACDDGFVSRRIFVIDRSSRISFLVDTDVYPRNRLRGPASRSQYDDDLIVLLVRAIWAVLVLFAYSPDSTSLITRDALLWLRLFLTVSFVSLHKGCRDSRKRKFFSEIDKRIFSCRKPLLIFVSPRIYSFTTS